MWRDAVWRSYQFYVLPGWKGGLYASPTLAGSRPGALIAGAWAVMVSKGERCVASHPQGCGISIG